MKKLKQLSVLLFYCLVILTILFIAFFKANNVFSLRENNASSSVYNKYEYNEIEDEAAPAGIRQIYSFTFDNVQNMNYSLAFYTIHQSVDVYIDDSLVYRLTPDDNRYMGKTTSCTWVKIPVYSDDKGKECKIIITPLYKSVKSNTIRIYLDTEGQIYRSVLLKDLSPLVIGIILIIIGFIYAFMFLYYVPKKRRDKSLLFMGLISIMLGIWKVFDIELLPLLFPNWALVFSFSALLMLLILPFTWMNFIKMQGYYEEYPIINITCNIDGIIALLILLLQIFNIFDLRQTLFISQLMLVINIIILSVVTILFSLKNKYNKLLRLSTICYTLCFGGIITDMIFYYIMGNSLLAVFSLISYIVYIVTMGIMSIYSIKKVAYTDIQTGLYNRSRCHQILSEKRVDKKTCIVLFDLNNLKYTNDKYGHAGGDMIIVTFSNIIRTHIPHNSFAGRYGGDEFIIVFEDMDENDVKIILEDIKYDVAFFNKNNEIQISYSHGLTFSDKNEKSTLEELFKMADEKLYKDKEVYRTNNKHFDRFHGKHVFFDKKSSVKNINDNEKL